MRTHIIGGRVIDPKNGVDCVTDVFLDGHRIAAIGQAPAGFTADHQVDAKNQIVCPGLVDLNVALCEPGYTRKGTVASETRAAVAGGVTSLCCPPNTKPVLDAPSVAEVILDRAREANFSKVYPIGALTRGLEGENLSELVTLRNAGCVAFTNGLHPYKCRRTQRRAFEYAATFDIPVVLYVQDSALAEGGMAHEGPTASFLGLAGIPEVAETIALAEALLLVEQSGVRAHFTHLTTARAAEMIADAQARGLRVTADVALYQLFLNDQGLIDFTSSYHVQPPLRSEADRLGLREAVKAGVISCIASHHQPHEEDAKLAPFAATEPGISGVELLLPLGLRLVDEGVLSLSQLVERMSAAPADVIGVEAGGLAVGDIADVIVFDPNAAFTVGENWRSKGRNTPFMGQSLLGKVTYTWVDGRRVYSA